LMRPYMRPVYDGAKLCGPAVTVLLQPGDNWMLHVAAEQLQDGDVVVAGCITESDAGFFGELLATSFRARGGTGLVIDGGVRDTAELQEMDFPVFARAIHARGTVKETLGSVNIPVNCANATVNPGDVVVGDADGDVVVPRERVSQVVEASRIREEKEATVQARLQAGELGLDVYGMRHKLAAKGLQYNEQGNIMAELENFDLAHISAVEILTPKFDESLWFFRDLLAMREVERIGESVYLRCWDEYETYSIKLTASTNNGVGRTMLRATSPEALQRRVAAIEAAGLGNGWREPEVGI